MSQLYLTNESLLFELSAKSIDPVSLGDPLLHLLFVSILHVQEPVYHLIQLVVWKRSFISLPGNKISTSSKINVLAVDKLNFTQIIRFVFRSVMNIVEKVENAGLPAFSPFPTMFSNFLYFRGRQKSSLCGKTIIMHCAELYESLHTKMHHGDALNPFFYRA